MACVILPVQLFRISWVAGDSAFPTILIENILSFAIRVAATTTTIVADNTAIMVMDTQTIVVWIIAGIAATAATTITAVETAIVAAML